MDKISIISSQAVLEMSCFIVDTRWMSSSPLVNSLVKSRLFKSAPDIEPPFQFIHTVDLFVADTMLNDSLNLVIHCLEATGWAREVWRFLTQQFNCCTCAAQCAGALPCWNTRSLPVYMTLTPATRKRMMLCRRCV